METVSPHLNTSCRRKAGSHPRASLPKKVFERPPLPPPQLRPPAPMTPAMSRTPLCPSVAVLGVIEAFGRALQRERPRAPDQTPADRVRFPAFFEKAKKGGSGWDRVRVRAGTPCPGLDVLLVHKLKTAHTRMRKSLSSVESFQKNLAKKKASQKKKQKPSHPIHEVSFLLFLSKNLFFSSDAASIIRKAVKSSNYFSSDLLRQPPPTPTPTSKAIEKKKVLSRHLSVLQLVVSLTGEGVGGGLAMGGGGREREREGERERERVCGAV